MSLRLLHRKAYAVRSFFRMLHFKVKKYLSGERIFKCFIILTSVKYMSADRE